MRRGAPARPTARHRRLDPGRRAVLAGAAATLASPALARFPATVPDGLVFFVGNSFTRQHGIPALVCGIAQASGTLAKCHPHTANGAWLDASADFAQSILIERGAPLPGAVVLQDHSIAPLTPAGRQRSARAIRTWSAAFEQTVLFETWPRRADHPIYLDRNRPRSPEGMADIVHDHYANQAYDLGAATAPIGLAWVEAETFEIDLYAADGYHANLAGAWLAAMMLARALDLPDPYAAPPPDGLDPGVAAELAEIAERNVYTDDMKPL